MRVMPSRCATWVATVDLPVPGAPPISTISGRSRWRSSYQRRYRETASSPSSRSRTRDGHLAQLGCGHVDLVAAAELDLDDAGDPVRPVGRDPARHQ